MTLPAVRRASPLAAVLVLLLASGCDQALFVDMDIANICLELPAQDVPTGGGLSVVGTVDSSVSTTVDTTSMWPDDVEITEADLRLKTATFRVQGEASNMDFIERLALGAVGGSPQRTVQVYDWTRQPQDAGLSELLLESLTPENLYTLTDGGELTVKIDFVLRAPPNDLKVIPTLCFGVQARMNYGEML